MKKFKDIAGRRNGRLVAVEMMGFSPRKYALWRCLCDCGNEKVVEGRALSSITGTRSCGCLLGDSNRQRPVRNQTNLRHGESGTKMSGRSGEYIVWISMRQRCNDPKHSGYAGYGAKGIKVCASWDESFERFVEDMGRKPFSRASIDRIDPTGNYEPGNCRWANFVAQANNRKNNVFVTLHGARMTAAEASNQTNIPHRTILNWSRVNFDITDRAERRHYLGQAS